MNNHLEHLIERANLLCLKLNATDIMNDLMLMNAVDLTGVIIGLQRMVDLGGVI